MRLYRPKSIRRLLLIGFVLIVVPLIVALIYTTVSVDRLIAQGQRALFSTVRATQSSQMLMEHIIAMERNALQYQVTGEAALLQVYQENHQKFMSTVNRLAALGSSPTQLSRLESLKKLAIEVNQELVDNAHDTLEVAMAIELFPGLSASARQMLVDSRNLVVTEVEKLDVKGTRVQRTLLVQAVALVPAALVLIAVFTLLITRPLRQMDDAIRRLGDGDLSRFVQIVGPRDMEQLGQRLDWMRLRLLEVEEEKNRFLRHISHELKTPLTALREGAELINEEVVGNLNPQQREIASILKDNSLRLQKLIEGLLDFNVASSKASRLHLEMVDLDAMIYTVIAEHRVAMLARELQLEVAMQPVRMRGDRNKLQTLVDNLLSNAIKFTPENGSLSIALFESEGQAIIEVEDSGSGIPENERRRIFEAFYQGSAASQGHVRGTGLGLSIAREYAHAHKGEIKVVNKMGKGACFRVSLPITGMETENA